MFFFWSGTLPVPVAVNIHVTVRTSFLKDKE